MKDIKLSEYTLEPVLIFSDIARVENFIGLRAQTLDKINKLGFRVGGAYVYSYKYAADGTTYDLIDSFDYGEVPLLLTCIVDPIRLLLFIGNGVGWFYTYPYDVNGNFGARISDRWAGGATSIVDIDIDKHILFCACGSGSGARHISTITYDDNGNLGLMKDLNYGGNTNTIAIDKNIQGIFCGVEGSPNLTCATYIDNGALSAADLYNTFDFGRGLEADISRKILFFAHDGGGVSSLLYDNDAIILSTIQTIDRGGSYLDATIDPINKLMFAANSGNGFEIFKYNEDGFLTHFKTMTITGNVAQLIKYDEINHLVFVSSSQGLEVFKYIYIESSETILTGKPWDLYFKNGDLVIINEVDYLQQKIGIKLKFFYQEWFLDTTKGIDYFGMVFVKNPNLNAVDNMIKVTILEIEEIIELLKYTSSFNIASRVFNLSFKVNTIYGEISFQQEFII